ncbi:MAG: 30S ribosomal protein S6 [Bacteroidetes bacterium]|nr:30S ribosomal protein S6 [Bacteroidota bacterium]MCL5026802.1 30S ribosomal protein S6 [Chloroflexota bacterium]
MRDYELVLIVNPEVSDEALGEVLGRVRGAIAARGGEVTDVNVWGRRRIAFTIKQFRHGIYAALTAKMDPAATGELEHGLSLSEDIIRHLLIKLEKAPVKQVQQAVEEKEESKEQSDDGGDTE